MTCFGNIFAYFVVDKARFSIEVMRPKVNLGLTFLVQYRVSFSYRKNMKYSLQKYLKNCFVIGYGSCSALNMLDGKKGIFRNSESTWMKLMSFCIR